MAQTQVQPNKAAPSKAVLPPKAPGTTAAPAVPAAVQSTKTEVAKRELVWPNVAGFYGKQASETQADTFGTMVRSIKIVHGDEHKVIGVLQKDGKKVDGVLPTLQRQLIKLGLVAWFTNPSAIKARGYHRAAAKYGKEMADILGSMSKKGYSLECVYGTKGGRLFADPAVLASYLISVITLEKATSERWPSAEPGVEEVVDEAVTEEVSLNLLG